MKASELLGRTVLDARGDDVGVVHDLRAILPGNEEGSPAKGAATGQLRIVGLVIGPDTWRCRLAHAWGFAQGHARGPWLLKVLVGQDRVDVVPTTSVADWDLSGRVQLREGPR